MTNKQQQNNKIIWVIVALIVVALAVAAYFSIQKKNQTAEIESDAGVAVEQQTEAQLFSAEYPYVSSDNVFVYRDGQQIIDILKNGSGVVYLGFNECDWCQAYVPTLNAAAQEVGMEKIYYFNILQDRTDNSQIYQEIVTLLGDNLDFDDEGRPRIFVPDVTFVNNGTIVGHNNDTSQNTVENDGTPQEYWTVERIETLKNALVQNMSLIETGTCGSACDI